MSSVSERLSGDSFEKQLAFGQIAETEIARWLLDRGNFVLPVYDIEYDSGKGPRLFGKNEQIVAPDLVVIRHDKSLCWIEAKHKTVFTWSGRHKKFVTGIDLHHYENYLRAAKVTGWPLWLLFLHSSGTTDGREVHRWNAPPQCPTGLFGNELGYLRKMENHRDSRHGHSGMVYWAESSLKKLASLSEVNAVASPKQENRNGPPAPLIQGEMF